MNNLIKRILIAVIFIPIIIYLLWLGGDYWFGFILLLTVLSLWEYAKIIEIERLADKLVLVGMGIIIGGLFLQNDYRGVLSIIIFYIVIQSFLVLSRGKKHLSWENISFPITGLIIWGLFPFYSYKIRNLVNNDCGFLIALFPLILSWVVDTFAYFGGKLFGKHKLANELSPNKTVEGCVIGIIFGFITTVIMYPITKKYLGIWIFPLGLMGSLMGQLGDLFESMLKRRFNTKDSSKVIPGHGGILDRFDSFIFIQPFFYLLYYMILNIGL